MLYRGNVLFARQSEISLREPTTRSNSIGAATVGMGSRLLKNNELSHARNTGVYAIDWGSRVI